MLLANPEPYTCQVGLDATYGKTAVNSGDTYPYLAPGRCMRTSCWLSHVPASVTVPARSRLVVRFEVEVPRGTGPGDYLAGVLVRPDATGSVSGRSSHDDVGAVLTTSVGIGVAVQVPGPLHPQITIRSVALDVSSGTPLLHIVEHNSGTTWEHPAGGAIIASAAGRRSLRLGVVSDTLLPGDSAALTLPVEGVGRGSHPTEVELWYAHDHLRAIWRGTLAFPYSVPAPNSRTTTPVVIETATTPGWIVALAGGLGGLVLLLGLLLLLAMRRRRRDPTEPGAVAALAVAPAASGQRSDETGAASPRE